MEIIIKKYQNFMKASDTFSEVIELFVRTKNDISHVEYKLYVGGVIKHFEMTHEV